MKFKDKEKNKLNWRNINNILIMVRLKRILITKNKIIRLKSKQGT